MRYIIKQIKNLKYYLVSLLLVSFLLLPLRTANAAQLTSRSLTLGSSAASATTTHDFAFTVATTDDVGSIIFQYCTTASGSCTGPTGLDVSGATLDAETGATGFAVDGTTDTDTVVLDRTPASVSASQAVTYTIGSAVNNSTANETFYVRISTTDAADGGGSTVDTGVVAAATATGISLSGTNDESLVFCAGTSITGTDCGTISGSSVSFGTFSTTATSSGTSVMAASTNADSGYSITVNGATLTSGADTITALATQTASSVGGEQFGLNLKDNTTPNVGTEVSGSGTATATANYGTADSYRFVTGDSVASVAAPTLANTFTAAYIVNVAGTTEPGTYTATMTYIATATF